MMFVKLFSIINEFEGLGMTIVLLPMGWPIYVAMSRISDHKHHYSDIVGGGAIGILVATLAFNVFKHKLYPSHTNYYCYNNNNNNR